MILLSCAQIAQGCRLAHNTVLGYVWAGYIVLGQTNQPLAVSAGAAFACLMVTYPLQPFLLYPGQLQLQHFKCPQALHSCCRSTSRSYTSIYFGSKTLLQVLLLSQVVCDCMPYDKSISLYTATLVCGLSRFQTLSQQCDTVCCSCDTMCRIMWCVLRVQGANVFNAEPLLSGPACTRAPAQLRPLALLTNLRICVHNICSAVFAKGDGHCMRESPYSKVGIVASSKHASCYCRALKGMTQQMFQTRGAAAWLACGRLKSSSIVPHLPQHTCVNAKLRNDLPCAADQCPNTGCLATDDEGDLLLCLHSSQAQRLTALRLSTSGTSCKAEVCHYTHYVAAPDVN